MFLHSLLLFSVSVCLSVRLSVGMGISTALGVGMVFLTLKQFNPNY